MKRDVVWPGEAMLFLLGVWKGRVRESSSKGEAKKGVSERVRGRNHIFLAFPFEAFFGRKTMRAPLIMTSSATRPPTAVQTPPVLWDKEVDFTSKFKLGKELGKGENFF